jgi:glucosyl-dolichyl phosphate glucuronosyltransferase
VDVNTELTYKHTAEPSPIDIPTVSVVICTNNRSAHLKKAIHSVLKQDISSSKYEIIVVDNASSDDTAEAVECFESEKTIRYVYEKQLGLCNARNTGWQCARGRYVAYLDDDAIANPGWLSAIENAFIIEPDAGVVGGRVEPIWKGNRPLWLSDDIAVSLTIIDWSESSRIITDVRLQWLVGSNIAVPAAVLSEIGGFHPRLDRIGSLMLSGGDVFLQKQIIGRGYKCFYYPDMAVKHLVPISRLNKRWFVRRYYWQGVSDAIMQLIEERPLNMRRLYLAFSKSMELMRSPAHLANLVLPSNDPRRFAEKCFTLIALGHISGLLMAMRR